LLLDIVISIDRIKKDFAMPDKPVEQDVGIPEQLLANDIIRRLERHFHITYNNLETNELTVIIVSSLIKTDLDAVDMETVERFVDADCAALIQPIKKDQLKLWLYRRGGRQIYVPPDTACKQSASAPEKWVYAEESTCRTHLNARSPCPG
jgi:hypothetical protein